MRPLEGQLRVCELEAYKAVYCGLCRQLGQSFGLPARFTLSYDASFLALLGLALAMIAAGLLRQEHLEVLGKAVRVCLECIGIG